MPWRSSVRWSSAPLFPVHARNDAVHVLEHDHFGAEPHPHRSELQTDRAGADHHQTLRHFRQRQRVRRMHDALVVNLDAGQPAAGLLPVAIRIRRVASSCGRPRLP